MKSSQGVLIAGLVMLMAADVSAATAMTSKSASARTTATSSATGSAVTAEFDGVAFGFLGLAAPLATSVEIIEYQDGGSQTLRRRPGRQHFDEVKLRVGVFSPAHGLFRHWRNVEQGRISRGELSLIWTDRLGRTNQHLRFVNAWMSGVEIDASGNAVVTLTHEGMQFVIR